MGEEATLSNISNEKAIGDRVESFEETEYIHRLDDLDLFIYMMLLVLTILTAWFFKHCRNRYIHETGLAVIYGLLIGLLIRKTSTAGSKTSSVNGTNNVTIVSTTASPNSDDEIENLSTKATFDPEIFFNLVLPAIIFNAGYSLKRKHFFVNIGAILMYAFIGTTVSALIIGVIIYLFILIPYFRVQLPSFMFSDALFYGAIISATDPVSVLAIFNELGVDVDLHALILGESVLNDAVAIVLSGAIMSYVKNSSSGHENAESMAVAAAFGQFFSVFLGAFAIGTTTALVTALITKFTKLREFPILEASLFLLMSYSTFLAAEAAKFSGIVALMFCGIFQAHYTYYNLSSESKVSLRSITELLSFLAENFCFVQIGVTIFTFSRHYWDAFFIVVVILAIIVGRAVNIYPLTFIINRFSRRKIPITFQHMMMFAGLRGAMAFALAIRATETKVQRIMFSTTLVIVIVTIVFCGTLVAPLLQFFHIRVGGPTHTSKPTQHSRRRSSSDAQKKTSADAGEISVPSENESTALQSSLLCIPLAYDSTYLPVPTSSSDELTMSSTETSNIVQTENQPRHRYNSKVIRGWKYVDANYLKPLFTQCRPLLTDTLPKNSCCQAIARILTTTQQYEQGGVDGRLGGPTPSPPRVVIEDDMDVQDTDDEPIGVAVNSSNITGRGAASASVGSPPRSTSFNGNNSNLLFQ